MAYPFRIVQTDLAGGINQGLNRSELALGESPDLLNWYILGKRLLKRPGRNRIHDTAGSQITGLFLLNTSDGTRIILAGQPTGIAALTGGALVPVASADGETFAADTSNPWRAVQYLDALYAVRRNSGGMKEVHADYMISAGIAGPTTAPTLVQGHNNGAIEAGAYTGVYTYGISSTGAESDYSPASAQVGVAAGKEIDWSITPSTDPRVDIAYLYRTTPNAVGQYFRVDSIPLGTYTYIDTTTISNLGQSAPTRNGVPDINPYIIEVFSEAVFISDGRVVAYSEPGLPNSFFGTSKIQFNPDDGHEIRALHTWTVGGSSRLVVGKTNSIYIVTGTSRADFSPDQLTDACGVIAPDSMKSVAGRLIWYDGSNVMMSTGGEPEDITTPKLRTILDAIPEASREFLVATVYPHLCQYRLSTGTYELIYNYQEQVWTISQYPGNTSPQVYGPVQLADSDYSPLVYSAMGADGYIYDMTPGSYLADDGADIYSRWRSKQFDSSRQQPPSDHNPGTEMAMRQLTLHCPDSPLGSTITLSLFLDSSLTPYRTRSVTLDSGADFRSFWLSSTHARASSLSWQIEHTGHDAFELWGAVVEGVIRDRNSVRRQ